MKLIIQIPCFNEALQLGDTLAALPKKIAGIEHIEVLVIDDGSTDNTAELARSLGVTHVLSLPQNRGLANAFKCGIEAGLQEGADIIVNTDADNQYKGQDIEKLVQPIINGQADITIGARPISEIKEFTPFKKFLQKFGSWVVRLLSHTDVADATSGFRAYTRAAAMRLNVLSRYTYTLETIIQAGQNGLRINSVPIGVNPVTRPSRLIKSNWHYVSRSISTLIRVSIIYRPFRVFFIPAVILLAIGILIDFRFIWHYFSEGGAGHIQSLIMGAVLTLLGGFMLLLAILADLLSANRRLLEDIQWRLRQQEYNSSQPLIPRPSTPIK